MEVEARNLIENTY